ncbi:shikimate kinase [Paenibacillus sp. IITD108]|uniref:shikimate kinase n=1 Tax=Paenibacillus sp. IITD108 TaxID=3116649 RepID=UPI002F3E27F4
MATSGKSTIGPLVSKELNMTFIDTDSIIEQKYNKSLGQLLEDIGNEKFIIEESSVISSLSCTNTCISTGGSVVYSHTAMKFLKQIAHIVFINLSYPKIENRLASIDIKSRGIVIEKGKNLFDIYSERKPLYSIYADYTIEADDKSIEELVAEITGIFRG